VISRFTSLGPTPMLSVGISGLGALVSVVVPAAAAVSWDPTTRGLLDLAPLLGLSASPYVGLSLLAVLLRRSVVQRWAALAAAVGLTLWGCAGVIDAFVVRPDPLNGLVLWAVAAIQWAGVLIAGAVSLLDAVIRRLIAASVARRP
jgi:hypothetical protein